jgi:hypothetical protein
MVVIASARWRLEQHGKRPLFCRSPPLWAMGVEHALKTIAHRVGSYKDKNSHMADKNMGHSNFIEPDQ